MVCDEGACTGSAGDALQNGCLHLGVACLVQHSTHRLNDGSPLQEGLFHPVVHHQVHIALAVAQFGVFKRVVGHTVLVLHDRQRLDALGQYGQLLGMDADFAHLGAEHKSFDADEVAQVEQTLEHGGVHILVLFRADVITGDVHLDATFGVLQFDEGGFAHHAAAHHTSGHGYLPWFGIILEFCFDIGREGIGYILCCGIGLDAHRAKFIHTVASNDFLFT